MRIWLTARATSLGVRARIYTTGVQLDDATGFTLTTPVIAPGTSLVTATGRLNFTGAVSLVCETDGDPGDWGKTFEESVSIILTPIDTVTKGTLIGPDAGTG